MLSVLQNTDHRVAIAATVEKAQLIWRCDRGAFLPHDQGILGNPARVQGLRDCLLSQRLAIGRIKKHQIENSNLVARKAAGIAFDDFRIGFGDSKRDILSDKAKRFPPVINKSDMRGSP